jgi:chaperone LolA
MSFLAAVLWTVLVLPQAKPGPDLNSLLDKVEANFARMSDFSADFDQITVLGLNQTVSESGHLYLKRDRMMRWEYRVPRGEKVFVSDGKTVYSYVSADKTVYRDPVKKVLDDRMPLLFLLGRSNLKDEFKEFQERPGEKPIIPGDRVVVMTPKKKTDFEQVKIEVDPVGFHVRRLTLRRSDGTGIEYVFRNIDDKTKRDAKFFEFRIPPGVRVEDGI